MTANRGKAEVPWRGFEMPSAERRLPPAAAIQIDRIALTAIAALGPEAETENPAQRGGARYCTNKDLQQFEVAGNSLA